MNKLLLALLVTLVFGPAQAADNAIVLTPGVGVTERSVDVGSGVQSPGVTIVNSTGANVVGAGTTVPVSAAALPLPTGASTSALQPTNAAAASTSAGQTGTVGMGFTTTAAPAYTTAQTNPLSLDTAGNLRVNVVAGGGSGGTSSADNAAWTVGTTSLTLVGGEFTSGGATACTTAHGCAFGMTTDRALFSNLADVGGTALTAAVSAYGTPPTGTAVMGVNAFVTNTNANGPTTMANSSPVAVGGGNSSAAISISTATTTQLVALSGSTKIYVMAWDVIAGGTGNITLEYGTGSSCGTGTTTLTGAYPLTAQAGIVKGDGSAPVLVVPAGNALCALTSAGVQMSGSLAYQQF